MKAAVFLDKDGTLVHDVPYNIDPALIRLRPDAGFALHCLQDAGYALVLVSNQPGVAHGIFSESQLIPVWRHLEQALEACGVWLHAVYYCPHHPAGRVARYAHVCECRKPQPGLLQRAAAEHGFDLAASWMVGDILDDIEAGNRAGCRTVLLDVGCETEWRRGPYRRARAAVQTLSEAAAFILSDTGREDLRWSA
jgi:histidinol-phosphate phosphatase family protein